MSENQSLDYASLNDCEKLQVIEQALFELSTGKTKIQVWYGKNKVEYQQGSVRFLERERQRLRLLCGVQTRAAITIGRSR